MKAAEGHVVVPSHHFSALQPRLLFLPPTGRGYAERSHVAYAPEFTDRQSPGYDLFGSSPVEAARLFWYRWIAGHQVSFILWRTMGDVLERQPDPDAVPTPYELDVLAACVDGYSAMLLYSATVPREHYHADTRVRMAQQHPSFSGTWAPDYRPIRRLFRGKFPWQGDPSCAALCDAVEFNRQTHDHIADHLVPAGRSLLQKSASSSDAGISREKEDLFDNFFMTIRRPVSRAEVVAQLNSRVVELAADLEHHGLYPHVDGQHFPVLTGPSSSAMSPLATGVLRILSRAVVLMEDMRHPLQEVGR